MSRSARLDESSMALAVTSAESIKSDSRLISRSVSCTIPLSSRTNSTFSSLNNEAILSVCFNNALASLRLKTVNRSDSIDTEMRKLPTTKVKRTPRPDRNKSVLADRLDSRADRSTTEQLEIEGVSP